MKSKIHARKQSMLLLLTLLLGNTVYAQENSLRIIFESQENVRLARVNSLGIHYFPTASHQDADGDGTPDLIMTTKDTQGHLQDLLVVLITPTQEMEYWRVDNVPATLGLGEDVQFIGFTNALGGRVRHGVFVGNLSYLVDPNNNSVSWADDNGVPAIMGPVLNLTQDGFDDLIFFLPDTKQVRVWSIDQ